MLITPCKAFRLFLPMKMTWLPQGPVYSPPCPAKWSRSLVNAAFTVSGVSVAVGHALQPRVSGSGDVSAACWAGFSMSRFFRLVLAMGTHPGKMIYVILPIRALGSNPRSGDHDD